MQTKNLPRFSCSGGAAVWAALALCAPAAQAQTAPDGARTAPLHLGVGDIDISRIPSTPLEQLMNGAAQNNFAQAQGQQGAVARRDRVVVRFDAPLTPAQRAELSASGVTLISYLSANTYLAHVDPAGSARRAGRIDHANWTGRYAGSWKIAPGIGLRPSTLERKALLQAGNAGVVVTLFADADVNEIADAVAAVTALPGATLHHRDFVGGNLTLTATMPIAAIGGLAAIPAVQYVEDAPELTERNVTTRWIVQSDIRSSTPLYDNGLTGAGQVLGLIDTKPDVNHCSFFDSNPIGPAHRKILAFNSSTTSPVVHGTHVAGIAVGSTTDPGDFSDTRGVAYDAKFVYSPIPNFTESAITTTLNLDHSQGARVHTNSWGNDNTTSYDSLCRGIDSFSYSNEDDLVVFAVTNTSALKNPENCKNALAVGACQDAPNEAAFCSGGAGPTSDGRRKPEVFAPGCSINSALAGSTCGTTQLTGTSMAAPPVSAAGLLVRQYFTSGYYPTGAVVGSNAFTPSGALIKAILINGAVDMTAVAGYPSNQEGWGRVLAHNALHFPTDASHLFVVDTRNAAGLSTGSIVSRGISVVDSNAPLHVTLVWTDPPGAAGVATPDVNDLDLEVDAPGGAVYLGNVLLNGSSFPGGTRDTLNNVEQVIIPSPGVGAWTVKVTGAAVNQGFQGYALVVTGDIQQPPARLQLFVNAPAPSLLTPNTVTAVPVTVDPGSETLTPGSLLLYYRANSSQPYTSSPLVHQSGNQYLAYLPRFGCDDSPQFYVAAQGNLSGVVRGPLAAPGVVFTPGVGVNGATTVLSESFESAVLPTGWTASGLWHVTSACVQSPTCDGGSQWAYFGQDSTCTYDTGARAFGSLTSPLITLPSVPPGGSIVLGYCSAVGRENSNGYDVAYVTVNGAQVDAATDGSTAWVPHSADLTAFAGQSVQIAWNFDSVDAFLNDFLGWQVDNIKITANAVTCAGPHQACPLDFSGDQSIGTPDLSVLLSHFGKAVTPFSLGDTNGDGLVNTVDLAALLHSFGSHCPN